MRFIETVHIKWYGMYSINDFYNREEASKKGIFAISRVYAKNVTLLYIGQTKRSFIQKISELNKEWAFDESELKITLGIIEFPSGELYSEKKVKEIKSLLIFVNIIHDTTPIVSITTKITPGITDLKSLLLIVGFSEVFTKSCLIFPAKFIICDIFVLYSSSSKTGQI